MYTVSPIEPFGVVLTNDDPSRPITGIPNQELEALVAEHKIVLLRGYSLLDAESFKKFAGRLGPLLGWKEFGEILDLKIQENPANHIFTQGRVEMHWDGAYVADEPHYSVFQCLESADGGGGGETLFTDSDQLLDSLAEEERRRWEGITIHYATDKAAHYGGSIEFPLIGRHPMSGRPTVRFIEPFNEDNEELNPVRLKVRGIGDAEPSAEEAFLRELIERIYSPRVMYAHSWRRGDFLIADNHALLHGRAKLHANTSRHVQRIQVLDR